MFRKLILLSVFILMQGLTYAAKPVAPVVTVLLDGHVVTVSWKTITNASNFILYYAPFPDASYISSVEMGASRSLAVKFEQNAAFYVAVKAVNDEGSSEYSNIERFVITAPLQPNPDVAANQTGSWYKPAVSVSWQWQLVGDVNTQYPVAIYDIDLFNASEQLIRDLQAQGRKIICYFSAGSYEGWRPDAAKFMSNDSGKPLEGFTDEKWLDIRSLNVYKVMTGRLDLALQKGCDGVELDNVDGFTNNSGFKLTETDQLAFNKYLANAAHQRNLAVALKNDLDQVPNLVQFFDFSVNEQCHEYDECQMLKPFIDAGKPVLNAEYANEYVGDASSRKKLCQSSNNDKLSTLILPVDLNDAFRFSCQ